MSFEISREYLFEGLMADEEAAAATAAAASAAAARTAMEANLAAALREIAKLKDEKIAEQERRIAELEARQGQAPVQNNQSVQSGPGRSHWKSVLPTYDGSKPREYYVWDQSISGMLTFNEGMPERELKFSCIPTPREQLQRRFRTWLWGRRCSKP